MKFSLETARDLQDLIRQLSVGLSKLNIEENMESFKVENLIIPPGGTTTIRNKLTFIPKQYIITSQDKSGQITRSDNVDTEWTINNLYLENHGSNTVTLTVIFMR